MNEISADTQAGETQAGETQADRDARLQHGSSFGAVASAYAQNRPDYAEAAVRWALEPVWSRRPLRVIDLGAGTGKLTATLIRLGAQVTAVEPDQHMLAELRRTLASVQAVPGSAEDIPVPDGSADAVLAGQAMHWFDMDRALPEIARVLAPGGVLTGLWNVDDDRVDWVREFSEMSKRQASITLLRWRNGDAHQYQDRLSKSGAGLFQAAQTAEFEHGYVRTADSLVAMMATHSNFLVMDETERAGLLSQIRDFLDQQPETASGEFTLPLVTVGIRAQRA